MKYKISNTYGINYKSINYRKVNRAIKDCNKMTGNGWIVTDSNGDQWVNDCNDNPTNIG